MSKCITCGAELHPERAAKYNYCMARECQEKNAKGLTIAVVGMNKAAEEFVILDERTKADLASGRYHDQRRGSFGTSEPAPAAAQAAQPKVTAAPAPRPVPKTRAPRPRAGPSPQGHPAAGAAPGAEDAPTAAPAGRSAGPQAVEQKAGEARASL